ncbi:MAG: sigma-54-dependent transcriptional regulator [Candidatus Zhuqueibacterota bacterium]
MTSEKPKVIIVDDEPNILRTMSICFDSIGFQTYSFLKPQEAVKTLQQERFELAFVDLKMSPINGMEMLDEFKKYSPDTTVVIITAHGSIDSAIDAIKKGAYNYLQKPFDFKELQLFAQKALEYHRLNSEVKDLRRQLAAGQHTTEFITRNSQMKAILDLAAQIADSSMSVLIEGESGTGKELIARLIHQNSPRADKQMIKVNCAALPEGLLESELFGHIKGAFTGAIKDRDGRFKLADGGTIFLDEIAEMSLATQAKLLRVLQDKEYERLGEDISRKVDVRVIAATNKNIDEALKEGSFREDLFYRLNVVRFRLLPLRDRLEDIPLLIHFFLEKYTQGKEVDISAEAMKALCTYRWSGNVRELEHVMERAVLLAKNDIIELIHLPEEINSTLERPQSTFSLEEIEKSHIKRVLQHAKDYDEAAQILGIDPATLWRKRKKYSL